MQTVELTSDQVMSLTRLVDAEIARNDKAGDGAYNTHWEVIKQRLAASPDGGTE